MNFLKFSIKVICYVLVLYFKNLLADCFVFDLCHLRNSMKNSCAHLKAVVSFFVSLRQKPSGNHFTRAEFARSINRSRDIPYIYRTLSFLLATQETQFKLGQEFRDKLHSVLKTFNDFRFRCRGLF